MFTILLISYFVAMAVANLQNFSFFLTMTHAGVIALNLITRAKNTVIFALVLTITVLFIPVVEIVGTTPSY